MLFHNRPELAATLLSEALHVPLPEYTEARLDSADLTDTVPTEYRADVVVLLVNDQPVLGIIVEIQLEVDQHKAFSWPAYLVNLRARIKCRCCLLVVAPEPAVARWAAQRIDLGPGAGLTPLVLGPEGVPVIRDVSLAKKSPELAVLSALAHGQRDVETAVAVALAAVAATEPLDEERRALYLDVVEAALSEAARKALEMLPENYVFQGPSYRKGIEEGRLKGRLEGVEQGRLEGVEQGRREGEREGRAQGEANALLTILQTRGLQLTEEQRQRIVSCNDIEQLDAWVRKAVTATSVEDLFTE